MRMRILIYGPNFPPEMVGIGKYTGEMAAWLSSRGHTVTVISAAPYYPHWRATKGYRQWLYSSERINHAMIYRCPLWVPANPSGTARMVHMITYCVSSAPVVLIRAFNQRPHLIINIHPFALTGPMAWLSAVLTGASLWIHVQDFELEAAVGLRMVSLPGLLSGLRALQRFFLRRIDRVSSISRAMCEGMVRKGSAELRTRYLPNWVDTHEIYPMRKVRSLRREFGIHDDVTIALWAGTMNRKQNLETVLDVAAILRNREDLIFVLAGEGAERSMLERMAEGLPNVRFSRLEPRERLNALLNTADIHLLPQRAEAASFCLPSKMGAMLASGRPIVATAARETEIWRLVQNCGTVVAPGDCIGMARAIEVLAGDEPRRRRLGESARSIAVAEYEKEKVLSRFEGEMLELCSHRLAMGEPRRGLRHRVARLAEMVRRGPAGTIG